MYVWLTEIICKPLRGELFFKGRVTEKSVVINFFSLVNSFFISGFLFTDESSGIFIAYQPSSSSRSYDYSGKILMYIDKNRNYICNYLIPWSAGMQKKDNGSEWIHEHNFWIFVWKHLLLTWKCPRWLQTYLNKTWRFHGNHILTSVLPKFGIFHLPTSL